MSYEDTGQFRAVVEQLDDPLNDPLPDRPPAVPQNDAPVPGARTAPGVSTAPGVPTPPGVRSGQHARPGPGATTAGGVPGQPSATSPWFRPSGQAGVVPGVQHAQPAPVAEPFAAPQAVPVADPFAEQPQSAPTADPYAGARPAPAAEPYAEAPAVPPAELYREQAPAPGPGTPPQSVSQPVPQPVPQPVSAAEPYTPPQPAQDPGAGAGETAQLPVIEEPGAEQGASEAARDQQLAPPPDGGRAARRKAARQSGGHRARVRGAAAPAVAESAAQPSAPLSRVEARRAAKAAKDSPAVIASRVIGELFITTGVIMLLFVTYQLWWTNVRAHEQANSASNSLEHQWASTSQDPNASGTFSPGQGFAIMYIPKLDVKAPIAQGVSKTKVLDHGMVGHYDGSLNTAMPWDKTGNFAVAAHRNTHGEPFRYINHLVPGDKVVVETATTYYTYQVTSSLASTPPTNTNVLKPIPTGSGFTKPGRYITLTTCTPEFTSENRLIVWGTLVQEQPRSKGKPAALQG
ncbi:class E sortase [Streptomyces sp. PLK6-54]|uniref:Class E sortase n=2 Tax=Actinacidiphila acidipaludis TaxID=2873382 RepID=A0ABS7QDV2_9ACTN|nr:class E sortase [Streptomyces acidipaludis]